MAVKTTAVAYTSEKPWRAEGVGVEVKPNASVKQMMAAAKLNWAVEKRPLGYFEDHDQGAFKPFPNHFALTQRFADGSYGNVLDVCGNRYLPVQNSQFLDFADDFVKKGDAKWDTMGQLANGKIVYGLARLNVDAKLPGNDKLTGFLFIGIPHIQGRSLVARVVTARDVCNNTMSIALRTSSKVGGGDIFRMNHRNEFNEIQKGKARTILGLASAQVKSFADTAQKLHRVKMDAAEASAAIASVFQPDWDGAEKTLSPRMQLIMDAYKNAPGAQPGTAWGALNAVTYWTDHTAGRSDDKRLSNAIMGATMRRKNAVLQRLLLAA